MTKRSPTGGEAPVPSEAPAIEAVRRFNRFYTRQIGVLDEGHLESSFGLTEVRVLYELAHRELPSASDLAVELDLDSGYLSRILQRFRQQRLITQSPSPTDGRQRLLALSALGRRTFDDLDRRASRDVESMLGKVSPVDRGRALDAMRTLEKILGGEEKAQAAFVLRPHGPGDIGWVVSRHGALYAEEYGWGEKFEALVASIAAKFLATYDPRVEQCWIAERDGERVGSVFLVKKTKSIAHLRLLLVEPSARGAGLGGHLVRECERFARRAGYRTITLWTQSNLDAARRIYEKAGYRLVKETPHDSFGTSLVGQDWEKTL